MFTVYGFGGVMDHALLWSILWLVLFGRGMRVFLTRIVVTSFPACVLAFLYFAVALLYVLVRPRLLRLSWSESNIEMLLFSENSCFICDLKKCLAMFI